MDIQKKQKDFYLRILEWADARPGSFTLRELCKDLALNKAEEDLLKNVVRHEIFNQIDGHPADLLDYKFALNFDGISHLIDYYELQEARKSAQEAQRTANWSIGIAIATAIIATILSICQLASVQEVKVIKGKRNAFYGYYLK